MKETNDNKLEDIFFELILNNTQLNGKILQIYDLINNQNISLSDKEIINKKIFGFAIFNKDDEIVDLLKIIRSDDIKNHFLYKLIFELIEGIFNVNDIEHLNVLLSNTKEEIETDIIYFLRDIFEVLYKNIKSYLKSKKYFTELYSSDYLNDDELKVLLTEIETLFNNIIMEINNSEEKEKIQEKLITEIDRKYKIMNIK